MTTDSSIEIPIEPQPEPLGRMGWVSQWGQWIRASFLAATDGAQYRMLIQKLGEWSEVLSWLHQIRWEGPTFSDPSRNPARFALPPTVGLVYAPMLMKLEWL